MREVNADWASDDARGDDDCGGDCEPASAGSSGGVLEKPATRGVADRPRAPLSVTLAFFSEPPRVFSSSLTRSETDPKASRSCFWLSAMTFTASSTSLIWADVMVARKWPNWWVQTSITERQGDPKDKLPEMSGDEGRCYRCCPGVQYPLPEAKNRFARRA